MRLQFTIKIEGDLHKKCQQEQALLTALSVPVPCVPNDTFQSLPAAFAFLEGPSVKRKVKREFPESETG